MNEIYSKQTTNNNSVVSETCDNKDTKEGCERSIAPITPLIYEQVFRDTDISRLDKNISESANKYGFRTLFVCFGSKINICLSRLMLAFFRNDAENLKMPYKKFNSDVCAGNNVCGESAYYQYRRVVILLNRLKDTEYYEKLNTASFTCIRVLCDIYNDNFKNKPLTEFIAIISPIFCSAESIITEKMLLGIKAEITRARTSPSDNTPTDKNPISQNKTSSDSTDDDTPHACSAANTTKEEATQSILSGNDRKISLSEIKYGSDQNNYIDNNGLNKTDFNYKANSNNQFPIDELNITKSGKTESISIICDYLLRLSDKYKGNAKTHIISLMNDLTGYNTPKYDNNLCDDWRAE